MVTVCQPHRQPAWVTINRPNSGMLAFHQNRPWLKKRGKPCRAHGLGGLIQTTRNVLAHAAFIAQDRSTEELQQALLLHLRQYPVEHFLNAHAGTVENNRIICGFERSDGAIAILLISGLDISQKAT